MKDLDYKGVFHCRLFDPDGNLIDEWESPNGTTILGKNDMLNAYFGGTTQTSTWYIGLIDNTGSPSLSESDTLASHAGWTEITSYTGDRKEWVDATAASKVKGTTTKAAFVANADFTAYGAFLCAAATGTSALLFNTSAFSSPKAITNGSTLEVSFSAQL